MFRKVAATTCLFGAGVSLASFAVRFDAPPVLAPAALLAVASVGIVRPSIVVQVLSRATAWAAALFVLTATLLLRAAWTPELIGIVVGAVGALGLSYPMLHTEQARAAFHPRVFRHWFLAGAVATASMGMFVLMALVMETRSFGALITPFTLLPLAFIASLVASAVGLVRMRGWAVLLGGTVASFLAIFGLINHDKATLVVALPTLLMQVLPVLVARRMSPSERREPQAQGASSDSARPEALALARVASVELADELPDQREAGDDASAAGRG